MGKRNNLGQSAVEYIFLLAVVMTLITVVTKSDMFNKYLGQEGIIFQSAIQGYEFAYQNGLSREDKEKNYNPSRPNLNHPSFVHGGNTRFFAPDSKYPVR
ncbi:MAG: hypothetical protein U0T83_00080 [Bacteriovoracaceae bacterium]